MKKILLLTAMFLILCTALPASGTKANNGYTPTTYETLTNQGATNIKWIKIDSSGSIVFEDASAGDEQPDDAIGYQYTDADKKKITCYTTEEQQTVGKWINVLADTLDTITFRLVMAIHPFPSVMFQMYNTDSLKNKTSGYTMKSNSDTTGTFNTDYLLISNNYYKADKLNNNRASDSGSTGLWKVRVSEATSSSTTSENYSEYSDYKGSSPYQHAKWSIITVLFLTCFVAEMLFMTIYGYITGNTENVLKEIAKKAGITLALFVLVSALPFLLESMRYGFCTIVDVFYAPVTDSYYSSLDLTNSASDSGEIFQLPGSFLRQMKVFFTRIESNSAETSLKDKMGTTIMKDYDGANFLVKAIVWLLMLVFRIVMFFSVLKAALHIAVNIIEVYLLMGLTMILVPFTCFEPMKPLGAKCIMSLVTNLIECFVIMVLIVCVVPAVVSVCTDILDNLSYYEESETLVSWAEITYKIAEIPYGGITKSNHSTESVGIAANSEYILLYMPASLQYRVGLLYDFTYNGSGSYTISEKLQSYMDALAIDYVLVMKPKYSSSSVITMEELEENIVTLPTAKKQYDQDKVFNPRTGISWGTKKTDSFVAIAKIFYNAIMSLRYGRNTMTICGNLAMRQDFLEQVVNKLSTNESFISNLEEVLYATTMIKDIYGSEVPNDYSTFKRFVNVVSYTRANGAATTNNSSSIHWLGQLLLCFMGMYIPVYFVQQSTQITNALMNGSAGMESFANAMGGAVKSAAGLAAKAAGTAVSTAGMAAKFGVIGSKYGMGGVVGAAAGLSPKDESTKKKKDDQSAAEKLNSGDEKK